MKIVETVKEVREQVKEWKKQGLTVGFVPTMGYLHEGHKSLMDAARKDNDKVVVSIFVNPMQFGPTEDLATYPRDLDHDAALCESAGVDLIFHPEPEEMYEKDFCSFVDMTGLTEGLCGKTRPIHFRGVCTVVSKLFNIVTPHRAYFGEKDAQQLAIIKRIVRDLNFNIEIVGCPIIREKDGLAKSSRNTYLSIEERTAATILNKSLTKAKELLYSGERNSKEILALIKETIESEKLAKIDYIEIVDSLSLKPVDKIEKSVLVALAVYIGKTRLIDNFNIVRNSGLEYHEDGKIGVIKTKQIKDKFIDFNVESKTNLYEDNVIVKNKDVLFASMGVGSLGKTNIYYNFENNNEFIIDSTLKIFRKKINGSISPELLEAYLHTQIAQELIYQNVVGSSGIISVYESYLQELPIPIINNSVEQKIVENIKTAHLLYYQSKQLLEIAKRGVEIAIEQDENIATNWINQELQKIGVEL